ncbi:MAG: PstS family phosphate ABC transporter substrate-binding protein [Verrucomicrobia bacterium]|nr:PstS family phosphate ABC transporter substrate-binding protein [Verrucomicrobiota bacterium]
MSKMILFLILVLLYPISTIKGETITVKGSDTMVILAQKWAETYMLKHPRTKIQVTGGGSGTGFAALQNQTTDLANASRRIKPSESAACIKVFRKRPTEIKVCLDGLTVYVNQMNPIEELSLNDLKLIFTGKATNWNRFGGPNAPITVYSRENSSGTYEFFKRNILDEMDFAANIQSMPGTAAVVQAVAKDRYGIGYGGSAYSATAKAVRISHSDKSKAYAPTEANVRNQNYPIWRHLFIYINPKQNRDAIADYLVWIQSEAGQQVVTDVGYFPLHAKQTETIQLTTHPAP